MLTTRLAPRWLCAMACIVACVSLSVSDQKSDAKIGSPMAAFTLKDTQGKDWSLAEVKAKAVVVLFLGTECPLNNLYLPRLVELHGEFSEKEVAFVGINANQQDNPQRVKEHAEKFQLPFPVLKDAGNVVADQFGAKRTPEVFVLDASRTIRYRGRIDDQNNIGIQRPKANRRDLAEALTELLAGKPVSVPVTEAPGCLISRVMKQPSEATVTYHQHVAPILRKHCAECHRPGQIGPMSLLTYKSAMAWSGTIEEVVTENRMPPWHADPKHGKFLNDRRLSDDERATLLSWIKQGCAPGEGQDQPLPPEKSGEWLMGKPDAVFTMKEEFKVPAKTPARGVPYRYFMVPTNFEEDRWIQAAEAKPGNRSVVHHIIVYVQEPGKRRERGGDGIGDGLLVAYAPGDNPLVLKPGMAKRIPKGAHVIFQMHYTPNGKEQTDRSSVGLIFAKEPPEREVKTRSIANSRFLIPAGDGNHKVTSATVFREDAVLYNLFPHMHLRGKSFEYQVVFPDGKRETLLAVPQYDFNWQTTYMLTEPRKLPAGTRIECTAFFDNSEDNPHNPNPKQAVKWGDQTWEEMMIGFVDYAYDRVPEKKK
jgi:peroxiredoxin